MKKILHILNTLLCISYSFISNAQTDTWVRKSDVGHDAVNISEPLRHSGAVGFSIGSKGYLGTGQYTGGGYAKDFWEYDPAANTWTQKADFGGAARENAVGFSIGNKGYLGTGYDGLYPDYVANDFWEYDPAVNTWTQKANFGGTPRDFAVGFSIGSKGYLGTGYADPGIYYKDFWEYDPATDTWIQKTDFIGNRAGAVGFSVGGKGYLGTGVDNGTYHKDLWEYDPSVNNWKQKADFAGTARMDATGFSIDNKGYLGTGDDGNGYYFKDFYEYNPATNTWTQKADFSGSGRYLSVGFSIGSNGYLGTGYDSGGFAKGFYEFNPDTNVWMQKGNFGGTSRSGAVGFSIGSKGYLGTGYCGSYTKDFWEYDPSVNTWTQKADFGGTGRNYAVGFSIESKGYIGTGYSQDVFSTIYYKDFWEYDPITNKWTQKADFGGSQRSGAVGFSIGSKGYLGTGQEPNALNNDFWEYDPASNKWTQKANFKGTARRGAIGFSIGNKGYLGTGGTDYQAYYNDFWEYDPDADTWMQKADFGGTARNYAVGFSIGSKGYLGTGSDFYKYKDFWEYDPSVDTWNPRTDFAGTARSEAVGFSIGNKGYIGTGFNSILPAIIKDFWEYTPADILPLQLISFTATLQKTNVVLNWQTANEVNTSHFNIQRSFDGNAFTAVGKQNAAGNGIRQQYIFPDENVTALQQSTIFYRLQMVDRDGSFTYSNIARVNLNNSTGVLFTIYPNPAKDKLHISISCTENTTLSIRIADMQGRQVYTTNLNAAAGAVHQDIDISKMAKGVYTIQFISNKGITNRSFVKE